MNPLQIEYFLSVARTKSVAKSSEELFVSAPAISKQLSALEADLGVSLLNRSNKGMSLTTIGEEYYEFFTKVFAELTELKQRSLLEQASNPKLSLGILEDWAIYKQLQKFDSLLQKIYPTISIEIHPMAPNELMEALANGKLDIVLCIANGMVQRIGTSDYIQDKHLCAVQKGIVYADILFGSKKPDPVQLKDFFKQQMYSVSNHFKNMAIEENSLICNHYGFQPKLTSYDSLPQVLAMVELGKGFTILDSWSNYRYHPNLHYFPLNYHHDVSLFWPKNSNNPLLTSAIEGFKKVFS